MNLLTSEPLGAGSGTWRINQMRLEEQPRILHQAGGSAESLDRSAYEVLRYLLVNAGEVCTHDELLTAGWPGRIVTNNSLAKCVRRLRTALQDEDAQRPSTATPAGASSTSESHLNRIAAPALQMTNPARVHGVRENWAAAYSPTTSRWQEHRRRRA